MRRLVVTALAGLLVMPLAAVAADRQRLRSLWDEPAGMALSVPRWPSADGIHSHGQRSPPRLRSLWEVRPALAAMTFQPGRAAAPASSWPMVPPAVPAVERAHSPRWRPRPISSQYRALAEYHAARFQLPSALVLAVMDTESAFNPWALSPKQAMGLMQLVPHKGGIEALRYVTGNPAVPPPTRQQLADPDFNIHLGTAYLRRVLDQYIPPYLPWEVRQELALAAYNWGPDRMVRWLLGANPPATVPEFRARLERYAPAETQIYVRRVTERIMRYAGYRPKEPMLAESASLLNQIAK